MTAPLLPADNHVHSEWSWDTSLGDMAATCAQAVRLGVPSVAFTEHVDWTVWRVDAPEELPAEWTRHGIVDGALVPPALDVDGYLESVDRCRSAFPGLRIVTGVELGEPHWHRDAVERLLDGDRFTRVLASLHSADVGDVRVDIAERYHHATPDEVYAGYLDEIVRMLETYDDFQVLAHIDYPLRRRPAGVPLDLGAFEDRIRHVLGLLAEAGKVLELNTRLPLPPVVLRWWREAGGEAISFASDAHRPDLVAAGFADAVGVAEAAGFRRASDPLDFWHRA
jgi:histidinol-phosphatase (PHP family)